MATETDSARNQARLQYEGICAMVNRLEHCAECDGDADTCELAPEDIFEGLMLARLDGREPTEEERADYHDADKAQEAISEDPLSVEVRSDWHTPGDEDGAKDAEFCILLCTGGPAVRIIGSLDQWSEPDRAQLEYQDWFTPWEEYVPARSAVLVRYASQFWFGA